MLPLGNDETADDSYVSCCPGRDERCTALPMVLMILGLVCMVVGFAVPRDYVFDPSAPAREMEATENFYIRLGYKLDVCITFGMGLVAIGAVITSFLILQDAFCSNEEKEDYYFDYLTMNGFNNYGSTNTCTESRGHTPYYDSR